MSKVSLSLGPNRALQPLRVLAVVQLLVAVATRT